MQSTPYSTGQIQIIQVSKISKKVYQLQAAHMLLSLLLTLCFTILVLATSYINIPLAIICAVLLIATLYSYGLYKLSNRMYVEAEESTIQKIFTGDTTSYHLASHCWMLFVLLYFCLSALLNQSNQHIVKQYIDLGFLNGTHNLFSLWLALSGILGVVLYGLHIYICIAIHTDNATPSISILSFWGHVVGLVACIFGLSEIHYERILGVSPLMSACCQIVCLLCAMLTFIFIVYAYRDKISSIKKLGTVYMMMGVILLGCTAYLTQYCMSLEETLSAECIDIVNDIPIALFNSTFEVSKYSLNFISSPELLGCNKIYIREAWEHEHGSALYGCINPDSCIMLKEKSVSHANLFISSCWVEILIIFLIYLEAKVTMRKGYKSHEYLPSLFGFIKSMSFLLMLVMAISSSLFCYYIVKSDYSYFLELYKEPSPMSQINVEEQLEGIQYHGSPYPICDSFPLDTALDINATYRVNITADVSTALLLNNSAIAASDAIPNRISLTGNYSLLSDVCNAVSINSTLSYGQISYTVENYENNVPTTLFNYTLMPSSSHTFFLNGCALNSSYHPISNYSIQIYSLLGHLYASTSLTDSCFTIEVHTNQYFDGYVKVYSPLFTSAYKQITLYPSMRSHNLSLGSFVLSLRKIILSSTTLSIQNTNKAGIKSHQLQLYNGTFENTRNTLNSPTISVRAPFDNYMGYIISDDYSPTTFILPIYSNQKRIILLRKYRATESIVSLSWNRAIKDIDIGLLYKVDNQSCKVNSYNRKCLGSELVYDIIKENNADVCKITRERKQSGLIRCSTPLICFTPIKSVAKTLLGVMAKLPSSLKLDMQTKCLSIQ